jgi:tRNA(Met) cytidine acetyltransferase
VSGDLAVGPRHRALRVLRGTPAETAAEASSLGAGVRLWVGDLPPSGWETLSARALDRVLGRSLDVVVLSLHEGLDPDALARAEGLVRGGGILALRMPPAGALPPSAALAVPPFAPTDVTTRLAARFERALTSPPSADGAHAAGPSQATVVAALVDALGGSSPVLEVLLADRGRGKSSALGLAAASLVARGARVRVSGPSREAAHEVFRFAHAEGATLLFVDATALARGVDADVLLIDEAAQLPVPLLARIVRAHPHARIALATTCRGYEGTGRGFVLRFLAWARTEARACRVHELVAPIRWDAGDPVEALVMHALALDAEPAALPRDRDTVVHARLDRAVLAKDDALLGETFGLLAHAHYRTTPGDLHRMLDAPNLDVHVLREGGHVVAASLVAREGGLTRAEADALLAGAQRIRGHALADTLVVHAAHPGAGTMRMVRSVRLAVHPDRRGEGLARTLVEAVHASHEADLFGTVFGATAELVAMRRALGYEVVRVGHARGSRSGEPSVVMVRPASEAARALVASLRASLGQNLEAQLALLEADEGVPLAPALSLALGAGLTSAPWTEAALRAVLTRYADSAQPFDAIVAAVAAWLRSAPSVLDGLPARAQTLLRGRALAHRGWAPLAAEAGYGSVAEAMRAMRPAVRAALEAWR